MKIFKLLFIFTLFFSANSQAGLYADELGKCMINNASELDKNNLIQWMFISMSKHPLNAKRVDKNDLYEQLISVSVGKLISDLTMNKCRKETELTKNVEGASGIVFAVGMLTSYAAQSMYENPDVKNYMDEADKYIAIEVRNSK